MSRDHSPGRATIGPGFASVLVAAQTGAPWALERLYHGFSPVVLGYMRIQGAADPEDLTNEVFLGVLRRIGSFEGDEEKFRSWIFTIAHSRLIDAGDAPVAVPTLPSLTTTTGTGPAVTPSRRPSSD